ncbi:MAG: hypothetical protein, partial [Olavius algarvensis Gamma 1 endosymbiont]
VVVALACRRMFIVLPPVPTWIQATPSPLWHATMIQS